MYSHSIYHVFLQKPNTKFYIDNFFEAPCKKLGNASGAYIRGKTVFKFLQCYINVLEDFVFLIQDNNNDPFTVADPGFPKGG